MARPLFWNAGSSPTARMMLRTQSVAHARASMGLPTCTTTRTAQPHARVSHVSTHAAAAAHNEPSGPPAFLQDHPVVLQPHSTADQLHHLHNWRHGSRS